MEAEAEALDSAIRDADDDSDDGYGDIDAPVKRRKRSDAEKAAEAWMDRDDAARRGWIAAQAVVLAATAISMILLHPFASWMAALLVIGQGVYFFWREWTARRAPTVEAAVQARPSAADRQCRLGVARGGDAGVDSGFPKPVELDRLAKAALRRPPP